MDDSLLDDLFDNNYNPTPPLDEMQRKILAAQAPYEDAVQEAFGLKFIDEYELLARRLSEWRSRLYFREGFRLGSRLMREALRPGQTGAPAPSGSAEWPPACREGSISPDRP